MAAWDQTPVLAVRTRQQAMIYSIDEQFRRLRQLVRSPRRDRDIEFQLRELAWVSAIQATAYDWQMTLVTRLLLQGAHLLWVVDAVGAADIAALQATWRKWAAAPGALSLQGHRTVPPQDLARVAAVLAGESS